MAETGSGWARNRSSCGWCLVATGLAAQHGLRQERLAPECDQALRVQVPGMQ